MPKWNGFAWEDGDDAREGAWIQTYSGRKFYPLDARLEDICLEDIAHALANQCRFSGHCRTFYSVADHSLRVARMMPADSPMLTLWALLHDASEAYLVDLPRPLKHSPGFAEGYKDAEDRLMRVICRWAGLPFAMPAEVERADQVLLATERRDLLGPECHWQVPNVEPQSARLVPNPYNDLTERMLTLEVRYAMDRNAPEDGGWC